MIIKAKHHFFIYPFFKYYAVKIINKHFENIQIIGSIKEQNLPVLLISNHVSWWDGFWAMYLNLKILKRKFHFMMLEKQLRKFWFFNYSGGFSINNHSKSIIETLDYTAQLLENKENMVLIFPQGKINSMHNQEIVFQKGIDRVLKKINQKIQIIFVANLIDYFSNKKPSIYMYLSEFEYETFNFSDMQNAYIHFFKKSIIKQSLIES